MTPEEWSAVAAWFAVVIGLLTIVVTARYASRQVAEARSTREEMAQPNVVAYTEPNARNWHVLEIVVKNFGATPALGVQVKFNTPLTISPDYGSDDRGYLRLPDAVPILAPGQEWRTAWDFSIRRSETIGLDDRFEGHVKYLDSKNNEYVTPAIFDWASLKDTMRLETKTTHDVARTLADHLPRLVRQVEKVQQKLDSFQSESGGIWVYNDESSGSEKIRRSEEREAIAERRRRGLEHLRSLRPPTPTSDRIEAQPEPEAPAEPSSEPESKPGR